MNRPELSDYRFPTCETEVEKYSNYVYDLEAYCDSLEKALDRACRQIILLSYDLDDIRGTWSIEEWKEEFLEDEFKKK